MFLLNNIATIRKKGILIRFGSVERNVNPWFRDSSKRSMLSTYMLVSRHQNLLMYQY